MAAVVDGVSGDTVNGWTDQCHQALLERPAVPDRPETRDDVCGRRTQNVWHGLLISWRQRRVSVWDERRPYQLVPHTDRRPPPVSWHCSFIHTLPGPVRFPQVAIMWYRGSKHPSQAVRTWGTIFEKVRYGRGSSSSIPRRGQTWMDEMRAALMEKKRNDCWVWAVLDRWWSLLYLL